MEANTEDNIVLLNSQKNLELANDRAFDFSKEVIYGGNSRKNIALTFDDGPDLYYTPQVLEILSAYNVPATFMCLGENVKNDPKMLCRIVSEGHIIGNHSWDHPDLTKLSFDEINEQIVCTNKEIKSVIGATPMLFRPPYGNLNDDVIYQAASYNQKVIMWDVDSEDWKGISSEQIKKNVLDNFSGGSIILMHSAYYMLNNSKNTLEALEFIINQLNELKYNFVTVPHLISIFNYQF